MVCDIRDNGGTNPPWYWRASKMWPANFHQEEQGEYVRKMGNKLIQVGLPDRDVVRCFRIENSILWRTYATKRQEIRSRQGVCIEDIQPETNLNLDFSAKTTLDKSVNEVWLFHGTKEDAAKAIAQSNFRCSSSGCFGQGAYFAETTLKSDQYASGTTSDGCKVMLLCRVTLGNMCHVSSGTDRTAEHLVTDSKYDSVLGKTNHREFIVYNTAQIYPEYIMYYKKKS